MMFDLIAKQVKNILLEKKKRQQNVENNVISLRTMIDKKMLLLRSKFSFEKSMLKISFKKDIETIQKKKKKKKTKKKRRKKTFFFFKRNRFRKKCTKFEDFMRCKSMNFRV